MADHVSQARRLTMLAVICLAGLGPLSTWFSATAILPDLVVLWDISPSSAAWLTNAVQIGFVTGALLSSFINLPDLVRLNRLIAGAAILAAMSNAVLLSAPPFEAALLARFTTGLALACVYPPAMKLMSSWFVQGRGLALGLFVGAVTLGSSMPHLFRALSLGLDWRVVVQASSVFALLSALLILRAGRDGPHLARGAVFRPKYAFEVFRDRSTRLIMFGYLGHMWELYGMWAWFIAFATAAAHGLAPFPTGSASMLTFVAVGSGVVGCVIGGVLSDRCGRCWTTSGMMWVSAICCVIIGFLFEGPGWLLLVVAIIWGIAIVGDSAQFSAGMTELGDPQYVGTALTLQVALGYALTVFVIWLLPVFASLIGGWQWAFLLLAPGPLVGAFAMMRLRALPEAEKMAEGAR